MDIEIKYENSFLDEKEHYMIYEYCKNAKYSYGESDNGDGIMTGMVHDIPETEIIYKVLRKKLEDKCPFIRQLKLYRMYINCFAPSENPYFHTDGENGITFLYYPNTEWNLNDGGETQFLIDDNIYGIIPLPNRLVMFPANIWHKATSFRNHHRFSIAIKYS